MKKTVLAHSLFGVSLLVLFVLGAWWMILFLRVVNIEKDARLGQLRHSAQLKALGLGYGDHILAPGPVPGGAPLEVVSWDGAQGPDAFQALPGHPHLGVRPTQRAIDAVLDKQKWRRREMLGEGHLLFALFGVCSFMLLVLVRREQQHRKEMEAFIATVTHEMKTPLTGLKSLVQTFGAGKVPEGQRERLVAMGLKEAERLERMIENILVSGDLRRGRLEVRLQPIALREFLDAFLDHRRRALTGRPEALALAWEAGPVQVQGDPHSLQIVLENLVDNAFKYGGPAPEVLVRVTAGPDTVTLAVEDRGIGFEPHKAEDLFIPFHRAIAYFSDVQPGTGLGLSIARAVARRMKGELTAESDGPGKGSRFLLTLGRHA